MTLHRRSPRPVSIPLDRIRDQLAPQTLLASVQQAWPEAVGAMIAGEATPISERGGTVTISCSASVWAQELDLMGPAIVKRLNGVLEGSEITRLRCVAVPVRGDL